MNHGLTELSLEERYEQYQKELQELTMMSDAFMRTVLKEKACTEHILQILMGRPDLKVIDQVIQQDYKNLQGRSSILDCVVRDSDGRLINVEVQQEKEGASPKRARYYSGLLDMNTLQRGQPFEALPVTYVIFITRDDILGSGLPIYHIQRTIKETGAVFGDETHILYVDSSKQDSTPLGQLMHDLNCRTASEIYSPVLSARVRELKETEGGIRTMCEVMDRIYNWGEERGIRIGQERGIQIGQKQGIQIGQKQGIQIGQERIQRETALNLSEMGMPIEQIAIAVNASIQTIKEWLNPKQTS